MEDEFLEDELHELHHSILLLRLSIAALVLVISCLCVTISLHWG